MDLSQIKSLNYRRSRKKRLGRGIGSGRGKTCGRGHSGARSRSGWSGRRMSGGQIPLFRRLPKVGFSNAPFQKPCVVVNVGQLRVFVDNTYVTPQVLKETGIVKQLKGSRIKILGEGELERPLKVRANMFSRSAREKIESSGGSVEVIPGPKKPVRHKMKVAERQG